MHLFGFILRIYHDARSSGCQIVRVMHVFRTGDDVQRSCGVTNKFLSKVFTESLVWRIVKMTCDFC